MIDKALDCIGLPLAAQVGKHDFRPHLPERNDRALIHQIAMDIGKEVVAHIEIQYPDAIKASRSTFPLSVRNCVHNQIMAALDLTEEGAIIARLEHRKKHRRKLKAVWKKIREEP